MHEYTCESETSTASITRTCTIYAIFLYYLYSKGRGISVEKLSQSPGPIYDIGRLKKVNACTMRMKRING
jgi:hypothetical protein